jgi:predicted N-acetyltransferase YhbS
MHIRPLDRQDLGSVIELLAELGYNPDSGELRDRIECVLKADKHFAAVAEQDGRVVGMVNAYERPALEKPRAVIVQSLVVKSKDRRARIGKLLMASTEAWARRIGATQIVLHTQIDRQDAKAFYLRIGYHLLATSHFMSKGLDTAQR